MTATTANLDCTTGNCEVASASVLCTSERIALVILPTDSLLIRADSRESISTALYRWALPLALYDRDGQVASLFSSRIPMCPLNRRSIIRGIYTPPSRTPPRPTNVDEMTKLEKVIRHVKVPNQLDSTDAILREQSKRNPSLSDLTSIFVEHSDKWNLPRSMTLQRFLAILLRRTKLREVKLKSPSYSPLLRYTWATMHRQFPSLIQ